MNTTQNDITFYITEDMDGFVVHYFDSTDSEIWSEFYETIEEIKIVYKEEIQAGQFADIDLMEGES